MGQLTRQAEFAGENVDSGDQGNDKVARPDLGTDLLSGIKAVLRFALRL